MDWDFFYEYVYDDGVVLFDVLIGLFGEVICCVCEDFEDLVFEVICGCFVGCGCIFE